MFIGRQTISRRQSHDESTVDGTFRQDAGKRLGAVIERVTDLLPEKRLRRLVPEAVRGILAPRDAGDCGDGAKRSLPGKELLCGSEMPLSLRVE